MGSMAATTIAGCKGGDGPGVDIQEGISLDLAEVMRAYFGVDEIENARMAGAAYARRFDDDSAYADDLAIVVELVGESATVDEAVQALRARADEDFFVAEMVVVDGWALGLTEARLGATADYVDA